MNNVHRIKEKIKSIDPTSWWGDDYDVRFYLISKLKKIKQKSILDVGGGIGIILSEMDESNIRINLDLSLDALNTCLRDNVHTIENTCGSMTSLPFNDQCFDYVICSNLLEIAKNIDIKENQIKQNKNINEYPTVNYTLKEISRVLNKKGKLFVTTPNNAFYNTTKLTYEELKKALESFFSEFTIYFYNTYGKIGKSRKLNMANVIPKIKSKFYNSDKIMETLLKQQSRYNYSVSFFVEARLKNCKIM